MSRITKDEVHAAAFALNAKGVKPTIIKLREAMGKGSYSTIGKFLEEWNAPEEAQAEAPDVPESLTALLPGIWATCYAEAERMLKARADELSEELDECRESLQSTQAATDQAEEQIESLMAQLAEAKAQIQATGADCQQWREKAEIAETKAEAERRRGDEMKAERDKWTETANKYRTQEAEARARIGALEASFELDQKLKTGQKPPSTPKRKAAPAEKASAADKT